MLKKYATPIKAIKSLGLTEVFIVGENKIIDENDKIHEVYVYKFKLEDEKVFESVKSNFEIIK